MHENERSFSGAGFMRIGVSSGAAFCVERIAFAEKSAVSRASSETSVRLPIRFRYGKRAATRFAALEKTL
jgi:hypothetical protein